MNTNRIQKNSPSLKKANFFVEKLRKCEFCSYRWTSRVERPVSCPRCKRRFDYKEARLVLQKLDEKFGYKLGDAL